MNYLIIIAVCLFVFYRSLKYGIVVDDISNRKRHVTHPKSYNKNIHSRIFYALNGEFPVKSVVLDHAITVFLHTAVCCSIYHTFNSLPASLLFAVNVGNNQVSLWLNGKRYAVNALICVLAFSLSNPGALLLILTPLFQVSAITFPVIMALSGNIIFIFMLPFLFIFFEGYLLEWIKRKSRQCPVIEHKRWDNRKIILYFKTIAFYFMRGIFPYCPTMYPEQFKRFGLVNKDTEGAYRFDWQALAGMLVFSVAIFGYILDSTLFFGLMWWIVTISVFGNFITLTVPLAERYMYLPNVGLMLFLSSVLSMVVNNAWILFFVVYSTRLFTFMPMYKDMEVYLKHHCFYYPENDQAWIFRANSSAESNDIFGVMHLANEGLIKSRDSVLLWLHRASGFMKIGNLKLSGECLVHARNNAVDFYGEAIDAEIEKFEEKQRKATRGLQ